LVPARTGHQPYLAGGLVLLQVGTELVTPTEGQLYVPIDGAVTVPTDWPDVPYVPGCVAVTPELP